MKTIFLIAVPLFAILLGLRICYGPAVKMPQETNEVLNVAVTLYWSLQAPPPSDREAVDRYRQIEAENIAAAAPPLLTGEESPEDTAEILRRWTQSSSRQAAEEALNDAWEALCAEIGPEACAEFQANQR